MNRLDLPSVGTRLFGTYKSKAFSAVIVADPTQPSGKAVEFKGVGYSTLSGAAVAAVGYTINGWEWWRTENGRPVRESRG